MGSDNLHTNERARAKLEDNLDTPAGVFQMLIDDLL